ncbi:hypothetical protein IVG45_19740 [Methylomonas sp. LL1]|uniref:hypothetical protein n=1 Tax=Methylomonas sp. LL1 TaxID=2785785 RepID=UPI0018C42F31|nr:hypothetical protein [Methylomonas sp. LL1]QPK63020.1 hypothetical protein IVG45_19740 [Methylomonas sp. LL1]
MAELLFITTTIFVAYVVFVVIGKKDKPETHQSAPVTPPSPAPVAAAQAEKIPTPPAAEKPLAAKPVAKTPAAKASPAKTKPTAAKKSAASDLPSDSLKNPKTGEVAKLPGNYAFAKRWIKEALVEEGLLDKIYKNTELDSATTAKIQDALQQLKAMDKYQ